MERQDSLGLPPFEPLVMVSPSLMQILKSHGLKIDTGTEPPVSEAARRGTTVGSPPAKKPPAPYVPPDKVNETRVNKIATNVFNVDFLKLFHNEQALAKVIPQILDQIEARTGVPLSARERALVTERVLNDYKRFVPNSRYGDTPLFGQTVYYEYFKFRYPHEGDRPPVHKEPYVWGRRGVVSQKEYKDWVRRDWEQERAQQEADEREAQAKSQQAPVQKPKAKNTGVSATRGD